MIFFIRIKRIIIFLYIIKKLINNFYLYKYFDLLDHLLPRIFCKYFNDLIFSLLRFLYKYFPWHFYKLFLDYNNI